MYRRHLVPLPFPLLALYLKVVPLMLPTGSSTRKVPSARHVTKFDYNKTKQGFKLNDGNLLLGRIPRRFFKSDCEILHEPLRRPDLKFFVCVCVIGQL